VSVDLFLDQHSKKSIYLGSLFPAWRVPSLSHWTQFGQRTLRIIAHIGTGIKILLVHAVLDVLMMMAANLGNRMVQTEKRDLVLPHSPWRRVDNVVMAIGMLWRKWASDWNCRSGPLIYLFSIESQRPRKSDVKGKKSRQQRGGKEMEKDRQQERSSDEGFKQSRAQEVFHK
jgi:hypothetical protein